MNFCKHALSSQIYVLKKDKAEENTQAMVLNDC